tara:strand:- start:174 stop:716 length:543 start_codon:yes stop_codon:yes gene_type:complete
MPWKYKDRYIQTSFGWVDDDGNKHSPDWMLLSDEDKKKIGLVYEPEEEPFDHTFYQGRDAKGKLIERSLDDYFLKDLDGKDAVDADGNKQLQTGLKKIWIEKTKQRANALLSGTDWYAARKAEAGTAIPTDIKKARAKVRTESKAIEDKINACSTLADFQALFDPPKNGGNPPINNFTKI